MHVTSASNATPKSTTTNSILVFPHCGAGHYFSKTGNHNHFFDSKWGYKPYTDPEQVEGWDEEKILTDFISDFKKDCELPFHRYNENPDFYTDEGLEVPSKSMKTEHILIEYLKRVTNNHYSIENEIYYSYSFFKNKFFNALDRKIFDEADIPSEKEFDDLKNRIHEHGTDKVFSKTESEIHRYLKFYIQ